MKGKRSLLAAMIGSASLGSAQPAFAIMSLAYGWYLEGNVGTSRLQNENFPSGSSTTQSWIAGGANLGYKFMPFLGAEIGATYYSMITIKNQFNTTAGTAKYYSYDLAIKGILPFVDSGFEAFAKLGIQRLSSQISLSNSAAAASIGLTSSKSNVTGLFTGLGVQYYFTPSVAIVLQWARASGNNSIGTQDFLSLGLNIIFDC